MAAQIIWFRSLLVASIIGGLLSSMFTEMDASSEAEELSFGIEVVVFALLGTIVLLISYIGLFRFKRWARTLSVVLTLVALVAYPMLGEEVRTGWGALFECISSMSWGAALAIAYFAEVSTRFV